MWPVPTNTLLHGFIEGLTGWASATIWNSRGSWTVPDVAGAHQYVVAWIYRGPDRLGLCHNLEQSR